MGVGGGGTLGCLCARVYDVWVWGEGTLGCLCARVYDVWVWGEGTLGCLCARVYDVWVWGEGEHWDVYVRGCMTCGCGGREHWDVYVRGCMMCGCGRRGTLGCLCTRVYDVWVWGGGNIGMFMYEGVRCVGVGGREHCGGYVRGCMMCGWGEGTLGCLCTRVYDVWVWGGEHWDVYVRGCMMCGCGGVGGGNIGMFMYEGV